MLIFGMNACPDCVEAKAVLDEKQIPYMYKEISETTGAMKQFLKLRDTREEFAEVKAKGSIGVPCFIIDDKSIVLDLNEALERVEKN